MTPSDPHVDLDDLLLSVQAHGAARDAWLDPGAELNLPLQTPPILGEVESWGYGPGGLCRIDEPCRATATGPPGDPSCRCRKLQERTPCARRKGAPSGG